jgi:hypothetical protein
MNGNVEEYPSRHFTMPNREKIPSPHKLIPDIFVPNSAFSPQPAFAPVVLAIMRLIFSSLSFMSVFRQGAKKVFPVREFWTVPIETMIQRMKTITDMI